jgi:hypothetical protein
VKQEYRTAMIGDSVVMEVNKNTVVMEIKINRSARQRTRYCNTVTQFLKHFLYELLFQYVKTFNGNIEQTKTSIFLL